MRVDPGDLDMFEYVFDALVAPVRVGWAKVTWR